MLRSSDESNVRKFPWPTAEENEIESRARGATSLYVPLNKAMLAASATTSSGATILHIMVYKDLWKQLQLLLGNILYKLDVSIFLKQTLSF